MVLGTPALPLISEQPLQLLVSEPPLGLVPSPELMRALQKEASRLQAESQW